MKRIAASCLSKVKKSYHTNKKPFPYFTLAFKKNMHLYGKVSFDTMYDLIDSCDFISINIKKDHLKEFSTVRTTGSKQLALGFCKPCIIEKNCASYYGFTEENSILYDEGQLDEAVQKACALTDEEYIKMQNSMHSLLMDTRSTSIDNLNHILSVTQNLASNG